MQQSTATKTKTVRILAVLALTLSVLPALAERGDDADRKSKNGKATGVVDGVEITVEYGRPNVNGRKVWGGLVPFDKVWRTGADEASTVTFSKNVTVEGQPLAAGTYSLFTIPTEGEWTVIFNSVAEQWGAFDYDAGKDVLRVKASPKETSSTESVEIEIKGSALILRWDKLAVAVTIAAG